MAIVLQQPTTGSYATYTYSGAGNTVVALDVAIKSPISVTANTTENSVYPVSGLLSLLNSGTLVMADFNGSAFPLRMVAGSYLMIAGSISSMPSISTSAVFAYKSSGPWDTTGSGALVGGNFNGSFYPFVVQGGSQLLITGSVFQGISPWIISGPFIGISGVVNPSPGSVYALSSPGSINVMGSIYVTGSINQAVSPWMISGLQWSVGISGAIIQGTSPWITLGSSYLLSAPGSHGIMGSVYVTGSVNLTFPLFDLGSPGYKRATSIASGTNTNVWAPNGGSKVQIHGWEVSSDTPMSVFIQISGANASQIVISQYILPGSGTAIKTFVHPITPASAGSPIGFGNTAAGSVSVTIYGREVV